MTGNTPRAQVRLARPADAAAIASIYRPYVTDAATSFEIDPPDAGEMNRRMAALESFAPWLVAVERRTRDPQRVPHPPRRGSGGEAACAPRDHQPEVVVGYAYASPHRDRAAYRWSIDVTVYLRGDRHRRGIGRTLYQALLPLLAMQGFCVAHAAITLPNAASVGLHESLGFTPIGVYPAVGWKQGAWHDVGWWRLPLGSLPPAPTPPLSLPAAQVLPAWPPELTRKFALP